MLRLCAYRPSVYCIVSFASVLCFGALCFCVFSLARRACVLCFCVWPCSPAGCVLCFCVLGPLQGHAEYVSLGLRGQRECIDAIIVPSSCVQRTYQAFHLLLVLLWVFSSTLQLLHISSIVCCFFACTFRVLRGPAWPVFCVFVFWQPPLKRTARRQRQHDIPLNGGPNVGPSPGRANGGVSAAKDAGAHADNAQIIQTAVGAASGLSHEPRAGSSVSKRQAPFWRAHHSRTCDIQLHTGAPIQPRGRTPHG